MYRYIIYTREKEDCRPLKECKWWWIGSGDGYNIISCILPEGEKILEYWDDAFDIMVKKIEDE